MEKNSSTGTPVQPSRSQIPLAEWFIAGVGVLLVCGSLGFLAFRATSEQSPPVFEAELSHVTATDNGYLAEIKIHNRGGTAVASLRLFAAHAEEDLTLRKQVVIDYVPGNSSRTVGMLFDSEPRQESLQFTFQSYTLP